jgi:phosphate:Na+ symporter
MVPSRGDVDEETKLEYIGGGILATPELSILEAKKEIRKFGKITDRMFGFVGELIENEDRKIFDEAMGRIQKYEDITDKMEIEIAEYLTRVAQGELSEETSVRIRSMISMINDMERIGDICYQMSKTLERKNDQNAQFSSEQDEGLVRIMKVVNEGFETMNNNIDEGFGQVNIRQAELNELTINETRDKLRSEHLMRVAKSEHSFESGLFYSDLFMSCEKIGDHIFNINEAIVGLK